MTIACWTTLVMIRDWYQPPQFASVTQRASAMTEAAADGCAALLDSTYRKESLLLRDDDRYGS